MIKKEIDFFCCPDTLEPLTVSSKKLISKSNKIYSLNKNLYDFRSSIIDKDWNLYYENIATKYDNFNHLTFDIQGVNESKTREYCVSKLGELKGVNILEIGCGTGRDSVILTDKYKNLNNRFFLLDFSEKMISKCIQKLSNVISGSDVKFVLADAESLPFQNNSIDIVYSFTVFPAIKNKQKFFKEILRVLKPGGKFLMVSEGIANNLQKTEFYKIIVSNSDLYTQNPPVDILPSDACKINIEYILNDTLFIFSFMKTDKPREIKDIMIPGSRGGTLKTRYYGKLEGVSPDIKDLALKASSKLNISMFDFLKKIIKDESNKI